MLAFLLACTSSEGDTAAPVAPLAPAGLAGCTYALDWQSGGEPLACEGGYDAWGNDLGRRCVTRSGLRRDWLQTYDDDGCVPTAHWYIESESSVYEWLRGGACDARGSEIADIDRQIQVGWDGELLLDLLRASTTSNSYDGAFLIEAVTTTSDGHVYERRNTWTEEGWLDSQALRRDGGAWETTAYERDEAGRPTLVVTTDEDGDVTYERAYTYDALGRMATQTYQGRREAYTITRVYDGDTVRHLEERYDQDGDELPDETDTWTWSCP